MSDKIIKAIKALDKKHEAHICYLYNNHLEYIETAATFIIASIKDGDHVLLLENDRNILTIKEILQNELNMEQLDKLHFINNFQFYFSNETFHPQTVASHFLKYIQPFVDNGDSYRTWGHIEWGCEKELENDIEEYEKEIDKLIKDRGVISVCAYWAEITPESLKEKLKNCHDIVINGHE